MKVNNELVDSYSIKKFGSGIILLMFNTKDKWIGYHRESDTRYCFSKEMEVLGVWENIGSDPIEVLDLPFDSDRKYMCTQAQNKDQIYYYYIPYNLIT